MIQIPGPIRPLPRSSPRLNLNSRFGLRLALAPTPKPTLKPSIETLKPNTKPNPKPKPKAKPRHKLRLGHKREPQAWAQARTLRSSRGAGIAKPKPRQLDPKHTLGLQADLKPRLKRKPVPILTPKLIPDPSPKPSSKVRRKPKSNPRHLSWLWHKSELKPGPNLALEPNAECRAQHSPRPKHE